MLGPWSACLEESLGPWSSVVDEGRDKTTHSVVKAPTSKFGPWQPSMFAAWETKESASSVAESRSHKGSKRQGSMPLGPWGAANKQEQGPEQRGAGMSEQSLKRARIDMAQACVVEVPHHVRAHNTPITKTSERAKDPKAVKARCSGNGRCMCVCGAHETAEATLSPTSSSMVYSAVVRQKIRNQGVLESLRVPYGSGGI